MSVIPYSLLFSQQSAHFYKKKRHFFSWGYLLIFGSRIRMWIEPKFRKSTVKCLLVWKIICFMRSHWPAASPTFGSDSSRLTSPVPSLPSVLIRTGWQWPALYRPYVGFDSSVFTSPVPSLLMVLIRPGWPALYRPYLWFWFVRIHKSCTVPTFGSDSSRLTTDQPCTVPPFGSDSFGLTSPIPYLPLVLIRPGWPALCRLRSTQSDRHPAYTTQYWTNQINNIEINQYINYLK